MFNVPSQCFLPSITGADPGNPERGGGGGGGSKIKFMKGLGAGGGVPHPWWGLGHSPQPLFLVSHIFGMKIKALFTMILLLNNLILTASSITFGLAL